MSDWKRDILDATMEMDNSIENFSATLQRLLLELNESILALNKLEAEIKYLRTKNEETEQEIKLARRKLKNLNSCKS